MISNDPYFMRRITPPFVWWKNAFSTKQLDDLEKFCGNHELFESVVMVEKEKLDSDKNIRISKVRFFEKTDEISWAFDIFNNAAERLNNDFYQFDLYGYKEFQYTLYDGNDKGKYDWHADTILDNAVPDVMKSESTRKLTMIMLLNNRSDFVGGDFQLNVADQNSPVTVDMERGTIIAFPSFMIHRVTPVLSGIRKSIVIWVEGPKFR